MSQTNGRERPPPAAMQARGPTLTDTIKEALLLEIEARRNMFDCGTVYNSVHFLVVINEREQTVKKVIVRTQSGDKSDRR